MNFPCSFPSRDRQGAVLPLPLLLLLLSLPSLAQERAQLMGVIRDSSGAIVPETDVSVYNTDLGVRRSTRTDQQGVYAISSLRAGSYKITVRRPGFRTIARTGVLLGATERGRVDFLLEIGNIQEVVNVQGAVERVSTNDAASLMIFSRDPLDNLPVNNRGIQATPEFAPGLVLTPATRGEAGQFTANGQRPNTNYFTVDGVGVNNGISGSGLPGEFPAGALPGMTAIGSLHGLVSALEVDEVRVQTSTFSPEFGRLPGAQIAVVTRSGSNDWHGEFFGSWRPHRLGAADSFAKRAALEPLTAESKSAGAVLSGPVIRDRFFLSTSAEWLTLRQAATWRIPVPSTELRRAAPAIAHPVLDAFPIPHTPLGQLAAEHTAQTAWPGRVLTNSIRTDHAVTASALAFVRFTHTASDSRAGYIQTNEARFRSANITAGILNSFGPGITSDARLGIATTSVESGWQPLGLGGAQPLNLKRLLTPLTGGGRGVYALSVPGYGQFLSADLARSRQLHWNLMETLAVNAGAHQFRFGIDYQRLSPEREQPITGVVGVYRSLADLLQGVSPSTSSLYAAAGTSVIETFSAFGQDTWHLSPRLNLTYGVRWELTPAPSYRVLNTSLLGRLSSESAWKTRYLQFAPRFGAAYRLSRDGSLVLRAGAGIFYDLGFSSVTDVLNGAPFNRWVVGLAAIEVAPTRTVSYGYAPDLKLPWSLHWNVALEKQLARDTVISAAWVGSRGRRLLRLEGAPPSASSFGQVIIAGNNGAADYHSLQLQMRRSLARGLRGFANYTWSHSIDNGSWNSAAFFLYPGGNDRGSSDFDVRHSFQSGVVYDLPRRWSLSGILRSRTGFPLDVLNQENPFGLAFDNQRPDLNSDVPLWIGNRLNPLAFIPAPGGRQGSLGRNAIRGFGLTQLDLALQRRFTLSEHASMNFRIEAYNVTNQAFLGDPVRFLSNPLFGQSVSHASLMLGSGRAHSGLTPTLQSGGPRSLQLRVDFRF
jgi:hypothetical protein